MAGPKGLKSIGRALAQARPSDSVTMGGDDNLIIMPTGLDALDVASGAGGLPAPRIVLLHGPEGTCKTTAALQFIAQVQRDGGVGIFLDFERKLVLSWAATLGVDTDALIVASPPSIEAGFAFLSKALDLLTKKYPATPVLICWDSLHAAPANMSLAKDYEEGEFPPAARAYSRGLQKFVEQLHKTTACLLMISQVRITIDGYITKEKVGVGNAAAFYAAQVITVRAKARKGAGKEKGRVGDTITFRYTKNQVADPFRKAVTPLLYGKGLSPELSTWNALDSLGLLSAVEKTKAWKSVEVDGKEIRVPSETGFVEWAEKHPEVYKRLRKLVRDNVGNLPAPEVHGGGMFDLPDVDDDKEGDE